MRRPALIGLLFLGLLPDVAAAQAGRLSDPLDPSSSPATGSTDTVEESDPAAAPDQESTAEVPPGEATATTEPADEADPTEAAPPGSSSEESEFESPATAPGAPRMRMLVVDVATFGIDPVVGQVASARMRRTGDELGYEVLTQAETIQAAQRLQMPYPPTPADLWRVSWIARAHRGAFARIWGP